MASRTTDAFLNVNAVIEVRVIRQVVYADPLDRLARAKTRAHRFEIRTIGPDLFMTTHAHAGRRHSRGRRSFDGRVTVAAIDAVVADVMFVAELYGLLPLDPLPGVPGRSVQRDGDPQQGDSYKNSAVNRDFRQRVGAVMEDLWHCSRVREGESHRYSGRHNSPQTFRTGKCLLQRALLYQIDRNFQIAL